MPGSDNTLSTLRYTRLVRGEDPTGGSGRMVPEGEKEGPRVLGDWLPPPPPSPCMTAGSRGEATTRRLARARVPPLPPLPPLLPLLPPTPLPVPGAPDRRGVAAGLSTPLLKATSPLLAWELEGHKAGRDVSSCTTTVRALDKGDR